MNDMSSTMIPPKDKPASKLTLTLDRVVSSDPKPEPVKKAKKKKTPPNHPVCMSDAEFRAICKELQMGAPTIGRICKANERTARRWASGELVIPPAVAVLLRYAMAVAREVPYADMVAQLERETDLLKRWENERAAFLARQGAKP